MSDRPKDDFKAVSETMPDEEKLRDKDNAARRYDPPINERYPRLNIAPAGVMGVRHNLTTPEHQKAKRFTVKAGGLKREFKPIARNDGKDRSHER